MKTYEVTYKGKTYTYTGNNCEEAAQKLANRKVFGRQLIFDFLLKMFDADTRGEQWAEYITCGHDVNTKIFVEVKK